MGFIATPELLDFVSSLAVLGLLVLGFSALSPALKSSRIGSALQGLLFGLVVELQMSMPLSPADGVIIDMRNVPIVLAGAFLGLPGLLMCLGLAVATRIGLGGVGVLPGVVGMLIAGTVGYAWSRAMPRINRAPWIKLLLLGGAVNLHMLSALLASAKIMTWYYLEAAPTVLILNLSCVPLIGALLLREQKAAAAQARLAAAAQLDPATRLMALDAFAREVSHVNASGDGTRFVGVVAITFRNAGWLARTWGAGAFYQSLGAMRVRINALCADQRPLGIDHRQRLLLPVTEAELRDRGPFRETIRRLATDAPFVLDDDVEIPLSVVIENFRLHRPDNPAITASDVRRSAVARRRTPPAPHTVDPEKGAPLPDGLSDATLGRLFDRAEAGLTRVA
ncbi:MAG: LytS/YhcK type 5TM receptor domain-containing protein [Pseudomonadota bacterium]